MPVTFEPLRVFHIESNPFRYFCQAVTNRTLFAWPEQERPVVLLSFAQPHELAAMVQDLEPCWDPQSGVQLRAFQCPAEPWFERSRAENCSGEVLEREQRQMEYDAAATSRGTEVSVTTAAQFMQTNHGQQLAASDAFLQAAPMAKRAQLIGAFADTLRSDHALLGHVGSHWSSFVSEPRADLHRAVAAVVFDAPLSASDFCSCLLLTMSDFDAITSEQRQF